MHLDQIREHGDWRAFVIRTSCNPYWPGPQQRWTHAPDAEAPELAAAFGVDIVKNHSFQDGSKRVGFLTMVAFLGLNGFVIHASQESFSFPLPGWQRAKSASRSWQLGFG